MLLAPLLLLVGCSRDEPEPQLGTVPTIRTASEMPEMPLAPYLPNSQQLHAIQAAYTATLNQCLKQNGQRSQVEDTPTLDAFVALLIADRTVRSPLYGFFGTTGAQHGYVHVGPAKEGYEAKYPTGITPDILNQCSQNTEKAMGGLTLTMEGSKLPEGGPVVPMGDSRFVAAARRWSTCMQGHGFTYRQPADALNDPKWRDEGTTPSSDQKSVATADVQCKVETNLVGVAAAVQRAYEARYVKDHLKALENLSYVPRGPN